MARGRRDLACEPTVIGAREGDAADGEQAPKAQSRITGAARITDPTVCISVNAVVEVQVVMDRITSEGIDYERRYAGLQRQIHRRRPAKRPFFNQGQSTATKNYTS